ncbi:MAG: hypothetical protein AAGD25_06410 [Cyanobacteria bacterium P01_F01_bin.150]
MNKREARWKDVVELAMQQIGAVRGGGFNNSALARRIDAMPSTVRKWVAEGSDPDSISHGTIVKVCALAQITLIQFHDYMETGSYESPKRQALVNPQLARAIALLKDESQKINYTIQLLKDVSGVMDFSQFFQEQFKKDERSLQAIAHLTNIPIEALKKLNSGVVPSEIKYEQSYVLLNVFNVAEDFTPQDFGISNDTSILDLEQQNHTRHQQTRPETNGTSSQK